MTRVNTCGVKFYLKLFALIQFELFPDQTTTRGPLVQFTPVQLPKLLESGPSFLCLPRNWEIPDR